MRNSLPSGMPVGIALLSLVLMVCVPQSAEAKGLLESIFGFLGPNKPEATARPDSSSGSSRSPNPFHGAPQSYGGRYKTVCVRLCDGYFFPISNTSRRQQFYDDAQQCQSRCSSETRLFYISPRSPSIKTARDIRGFRYSKLKTAFAYRKSLKPGCSCWPKPWSVSERIRHSRYELASLGKPGDPKGSSVVSEARIDPKVLDADTASEPDSAVTTTVVASHSDSETGQYVAIRPTGDASRRRLIVLNASRDRVRKLARRQPHRKVAQKPGWGFGATGLPSGQGFLYPGDSK
jgi:hypothetical protein